MVYTFKETKKVPYKIAVIYLQLIIFSIILLHLKIKPNELITYLVARKHCIIFFVRFATPVLFSLRLVVLKILLHILPFWLSFFSAVL